MPMRIVRCATWVAAALVLFAAGPRASVITAVDEVTSKTETAFDSLTVGQRFHVLYKFSYGDSLRAVTPEKINPGTCRVMDVAWSETRDGSRVDRTGTVTFIPLSVDSSVVPANPFDFVSPAGDTIRAWGDEVEVPIRRIAATAQDLRPLKEQWKAPANYWLWGGIGAALLAAILALVWWLNGRRRRGQVIAPEATIPPDVIALAELDRIAAMNLATRGEFKLHYTLVVDTVRRYLEARYHIEAMDRTTFELMDALERREVRVAGLNALLDEADLVKFAKVTPTAESAAGAVGRAREVVTSTTPLAEAIAEIARGGPIGASG